MKKKNVIQLIPWKIRYFLRPIFYNGTNGAVKMEKKNDKDFPWFV